MAKRETRRGRRSFTAEFKSEAVRLCKVGDRTIRQVAEDLDLTETALREWVKRADVDAGNGPAGGHLFDAFQWLWQRHQDQGRSPQPMMASHPGARSNPAQAFVPSAGTAAASGALPGSPVSTGGRPASSVYDVIDSEP